MGVYRRSWPSRGNPLLSLGNLCPGMPTLSLGVTGSSPQLWNQVNIQPQLYLLAKPSRVTAFSPAPHLCNWFIVHTPVVKTCFVIECVPLLSEVLRWLGAVIVHSWWLIEWTSTHGLWKTRWSVFPTVILRKIQLQNFLQGLVSSTLIWISHMPALFAFSPIL